MITNKKPMTNLEIRRSMVARPDYKVPAGYVICPNYDCLGIMADFRIVCFKCKHALKV